MNDIKETDDVQVQTICSTNFIFTINEEKKKINNLERIWLVFFRHRSFVWKCCFQIRLFDDFIAIDRLDII